LLFLLGDGALLSGDDLLPLENLLLRVRVVEVILDLLLTLLELAAALRSLECGDGIF